MTSPAPTSDRPKILFVGRGAPWRGGGGYLIREKMWLEALQRVGDVTAALFGLDGCDAEEGVLDGGCERVLALPNPKRNRGGRWQRIANDLFNPRPRMLHFMDTEASRVAIAAIKPDSFDLIVAYRIDTAAWAGLLGRPDLLLDIDDPEHARTQRRVETVNEPMDARSRRDLKKLRRFERKAAAEARVAFVCQSADQAWFDRPQPEVAPNAVETPEVCPPYEPQPDTMLFVGDLTGLMVHPNTEGLIWFMNEVLPRIRAQRPGAVLKVGGKMCQLVEDACKAKADEGVVTLGFVDDMALEVRRAAVNLAPIRFGTGTRIKVLDSLAQGGALVTTTLGCEGIDLRDREHARIADSAEDFARACVEVLGDPVSAAAMGRAGHGVILEKYSTAVHVARLEQRLKEVLGLPTAATQAAVSAERMAASA